MLDDATERGLFAGALAQSEALLRALRALDAQGQLLVKRVDVDRLIDEVASVAPDPNTFAQARHVRAATDPAAVAAGVRAACIGGISRRPRATSVIRGRARKSRGCAQHGVALFDVDAGAAQPDAALVAADPECARALDAGGARFGEGLSPAVDADQQLFDGVLEVRIDDALLNGMPPDAHRHRDAPAAGAHAYRPPNAGGSCPTTSRFRGAPSNRIRACRSCSIGRTVTCCGMRRICGRDARRTSPTAIDCTATSRIACSSVTSTRICCGRCSMPMGGARGSRRNCRR